MAFYFQLKLAHLKRVMIIKQKLIHKLILFFCFEILKIAKIPIVENIEIKPPAINSLPKIPVWYFKPFGYSGLIPGGINSIVLFPKNILASK